MVLTDLVNRYAILTRPVESGATPAHDRSTIAVHCGVTVAAISRDFLGDDGGCRYTNADH
jgi:hypothetical protein